MTAPRPDRLIPEHAPMTAFPLSDNELVVGGIPLTRLAACAGRTPFYAYDRELLTGRAAELRAILPPAVMLHYAVKANPMPALVAHMAHLVDGLDVASAGELRVALDAGTPAQDISFAGPGKTGNELLQAVAAGILVNIESFREVDLLTAASTRLGIAARVAVRVNPDFELKSSGMKMGGGPRPFGVDAEQVPALLARIRDAGLTFEGFHLFAGSQNLRSAAIIEAQRQSYALALRLAEHAPAPIRSLNLGGGFGIPYFPGEQRLDPSPIADNLAELQADAGSRWQGARLVIELGRYLVGEAGIYVCRVLDRKISRGQVFLITDGGMHHHLAASGNFGQIIRKNYPVAVGNRMGNPDRECATVVGPLCTPLDILGDKLPLAHAQPDDLIVIFQSGAYGASASPHGFLGHPAPLELLV
jgi:diaminopimelate decarboxylase